MPKETIFDFAGADSVTCAANNVVIAADKLNVTLVIRDSFVSR